MPQKGLSMRNVREILRLHFECGLSRRQIARSCNLSHSTVVAYLKRATQAGLSWPLPPEMDDTALERLLAGPAPPPTPQRPLPDTAYLLQEMRKKHVTLALLWQEYREAHPDGYGYTQFCHYYHEARRHLDVTLRQEHRAGEKLFTDFAGDTLPVVDPHTGENHPAYLFVAVLGASNYTFARAVLRCQGRHENAQKAEVKVLTARPEDPLPGPRLPALPPLSGFSSGLAGVLRA